MMDYDNESYGSGDDMPLSEEEGAEVPISNAPIDEDALESFIGSGRSIDAKLHPYLDRGIAWINGKPKNKHTKEQDIAPFHLAEASIYQLPGHYEGILDKKLTDLTARCAEIFEELQYTYNDNPDADLVQALSNASQSMRETVESIVADLGKVAASEGLVEADEAWQRVLFDAVGVWQCAEAIYLPPQRDMLLCDRLMSWVNYIDPRPTQEDGADIMITRKPYLHPGFWDYVSKGILRGLFDMVGATLQNSGLLTLDTSVARATNDLCLLLRTCPRVSSYPTNIQEFRDRHKVWRSKVARAGRDLALSDPELSVAFRQVYELLKGDKDAVYRQADSWQECLAALALLFDPVGLKTPKDVRILFEMITESEDFGLTVDRTLPSEEACAAFCAELIPKGITKARAVDLSLAAHLADLLEKAEVLEDIRSGDLDLTLRDVLILALGDHCMTIPNSWRAATAYWRTVGDVGIDSIQQILPRIPLQSQAEIDEILTICTDLDLFDEASEIETVWARKLEKQGLFNEAIAAYDRAENPQQVDRLNWMLFKTSLLQGHTSMLEPALSDTLGNPQSTSSRMIASLMAPFATLHHFYKLKNQEGLIEQQTTAYLSGLITSPDVPKQFIALLMAEMLPFLNTKFDFFSSREIFDSLAAMEEYYDSDSYQEGLELLQSAMEGPPITTTSFIPHWRSMITPKFGSEEVLALVRLEICKSLANKFNTQ